MNKEDLIKNISAKTNMTKKEVNLILTMTLELIMSTVSAGEPVRLVGFGSFQIYERLERNTKGGINMNAPTYRIPKFYVGKFFKQKVNTIE